MIEFHFETFFKVHGSHAKNLAARSVKLNALHHSFKDLILDDIFKELGRNDGEKVSTIICNYLLAVSDLCKRSLKQVVRLTLLITDFNYLKIMGDWLFCNKFSGVS